MRFGEKIALGIFTVGCGAAGVGILNGIVARDNSAVNHEQETHKQHDENGLQILFGGVVLGEVLGWGLVVLAREIAENKNS